MKNKGILSAVFAGLFFVVVSIVTMAPSYFPPAPCPLATTLASGCVTLGTSGATVPLLNGANTWSGVQTITNATASTTTGTGALLVTGGAGIGGAVHVGAASGFKDTVTFTESGAGQFMFNNAAAVPKAYIGTISLFGGAGADELRIRSETGNIDIGFSGSLTANFSSNGGLAVGTANTIVTPPTNGIYSGGDILGLANFTLTGIGADTGHTDRTICEDVTTHTFYSGTGAGGICLGTSSRRFKLPEGPQKPTLSAVLATPPETYRSKPGYGGEQLQHWFYAEDVAKTLPGCAATDAKGRPNSIDSNCMLQALWTAFQQEHQIVAAQAREIAELKHR